MTFASKNDVGKITMFPNNIPHYTDIQELDKERITIAFDLITFDPNKDNYDPSSGKIVGELDNKDNYVRLI